MPAHELNTYHSQHGFPDDTDRDSCSPISTYEDRDGMSGVASPVGIVIHSEDSKVVDDSAGKTSAYVRIYLGKHSTK